MYRVSEIVPCGYYDRGGFWTDYTKGSVRHAKIWLCECHMHRYCQNIVRSTHSGRHNGDPYTGVSTQRMDEGVDTGDIILEEKVEIRPDETGGSLFDRLAEVGAELCVKTIEAIENGTAVYTPQDNSKATHTAKIHKELGSIDWTKSAKEIECLIRGLNPWPSAYTRLDGKTLKIWRANVLPDEKKAAPGCIIKAEKGSFLVQTRRRCLRAS